MKTFLVVSLYTQYNWFDLVVDIPLIDDLSSYGVDGVWLRSGDPLEVESGR